MRWSKLTKSITNTYPKFLMNDRKKEREEKEREREREKGGGARERERERARARKGNKTAYRTRLQCGYPHLLPDRMRRLL